MFFRLVIASIISLACIFSVENNTQRTSLLPVAAAGEYRFELRLERAVPWGGELHNLVILLQTEDRRWQRAMAHYFTIGMGEGHGYVIAAEVGSLRATFDLVMHLPGDYFRPTGHIARFTAIAEKIALGQTWTVRYESIVGSSEVISGIGTMLELPPLRRRSGWTQLAADEHPRLLFRKSDIPGLRQRLQTPFGQAAKAMLETAVIKEFEGYTVDDSAALGVLYQLTGDRGYAERARPAFERQLADEGFGFMGIGQIWGDRLLTLGIAYDCLRETWEPEFITKVENTFQARCEMLLFNSGGNTKPLSNWAGPRNAGSAILSLAMKGHEGDAPPPPGSLAKGRTRFGHLFNPLRTGLYRADSALVRDLPPLAEVTGPAWTAGQPLPGWVWPGLLAVELRGNQDLLAGAGGAAKAVPIDGMIASTTIFTTGGPTDMAMRFGRLPDGSVTQDGIASEAVLPGTGPRCTVLASSFTVSSEQIVRVQPMPIGVVAYLDAVQLDPDHSYRLLPGGHRVIVQLSTRNGTFPPSRVDPVFKAADGALERIRDGQDLFAALERGDWEAKGKPDFFRDYLFDVTRFRVYEFCWLGMGDGGFQAETGGYSHHGGRAAPAYALMHWNVFGRLFSGRGDIERYVPRHVFSNPVGRVPPLKTYHKHNLLHGLEINGVNDPDRFSLSRSMPFIEPDLQPASLWLWHQTLGVDPGQPAALLAHDTLMTFLTYPLEQRPTPPSSPPWPLTWASLYRGWFGFRNGWSGAAEDALIQAFANASDPMGWNHPNAGAFTVQARGRAWAVSTGDRLGHRPMESVVQILGAGPNHGRGYGRVREWSTQADGSGTLSLDLSAVYGSANASPERAIDPNGIFLVPTHDPITQGRFIAVDYSGKAGVPIVMVLVDRLDGMPRLTRHWQWMLPPALRNSVGFTVDRFTCVQGDDTLQVAFAHPRSPTWRRPGEVSVRMKGTKRDKLVQKKIKAEKDAAQQQGPQSLEDLGIIGGDNQAGLDAEAAAKKKAAEDELMNIDFPLDGIGAQGPDHFFAIATIGPATPPVLEIQGYGLDSVIRIGQRSYRFDGTRVVVDSR